MAYKKQLQVRYIDEEIYYKMLSRMPVVDVDNFKDYTYGIFGYNKQTTAVRCKNDPKQFICLKLFEEVCYPKKYWTPEGSWKQIRYILDNDKAEPLLPYKETLKMTNKNKKPLRMYYIDTLTYNELIATHKTITVDKFGEYIYGFGPQNNICKNTTVMVEMNPLNGRQSCIATVNMVNVIYKLNNRKTFLIEDKPYKQYRFVCDDDAVADGKNNVIVFETLKENGKSFRKLFHRIYKSSPVFTNSFLFEQMQSLFDTCIKTHINTNDKRRKIKNEEIIDLFLTDKGSITYLNRKDDYEEFDAYNQLMNTLLNNKKSKIEDVIKSILC